MAKLPDRIDHLRIGPVGFRGALTGAVGAGMMAAGGGWLAAVLVMLGLGTLLGVRLNKVVPREWFLRVILWFVLAAGVKLLLG